MENIEQGSDAWKKLRLGKVTASRIKDIIAKTKSGYSASRANYRDELVKERFGITSESFITPAMQHGIDTEPFARATYELKHNVMVKEVAFINHPKIEMAGMSPDGLVNNDGLIEIKCCNTSTHFDYLLDGVLPEKYKPQIAWQLACSEREWVDFISFDNRLDSDLEYFEIRYQRDEDYIKYLEFEVIQFLKEVDERMDKINEYRRKNF